MNLITKISSSNGWGLTSASNEVKNIIKVTKYLENKTILLKETTRKTRSQEEGFLNFLRPLVVAGLPNLITKISSSNGWGLTSTSNEIKNIIKVTKYLENKRILLKETTRKTSSQEEGFLNFLRPLMVAGLPKLKNLLTPLAKSVLLLFALTAEISKTDSAIQKKIFVSGTTALF